MRCVLVTGMSGAGKTSALKKMEDMGFFCVDNMPPALMLDFIEICKETQEKITKLAFGTDIRSGTMIDNAIQTIEKIRRKNINVEVLFLECRTDVLVSRYKESRRPHPLLMENKGEGLVNAIESERTKLEFLKNYADFVIDTSDATGNEVGEKLKKLFITDANTKMTVNVISFGFKHGIPMDCDLVFDVRFMPNPFYIPSMREHTGKDDDVNEYVLSSPVTEEFLQKIKSLLDFLIPHYIAEGKANLTIGIGCTGGRHRSVAVADELFKWLSDNKTIYSGISHRDIGKSIKR